MRTQESASNDPGDAPVGSSGGQIRVSADGLERFCVSCLETLGLGADAATTAAEVLVRTSLRGTDTHGITMFPDHVKRLRAGGINPKARPLVVAETAATAVLDGQAGLGQFIAAEATKLALQKARGAGCGAVLVRNSSHLGASGTYALMCAEAGMVGSVLTNGRPTIRVTGGKGQALSSGTRAYAVPTAGHPVVLDISMAPSGMKILQAAEHGDRLPEGWLEDAEGRPTTDPNEFERGGARIPMGDHKGYGLALVGELIVGVLSGSGPAAGSGPFAGFGAGEFHRAWNIGHAIVALDVTAFMPTDEFKKRVSELLDGIRSSPRAEGTKRILIPGDRAAETEARRRVEGIPIDDRTWNRLADAAANVGFMDALEAARV